MYIYICRIVYSKLPVPSKLRRSSALELPFPSGKYAIPTASNHSALDMYHCLWCSSSWRGLRLVMPKAWYKQSTYGKGESSSHLEVHLGLQEGRQDLSFWGGSLSLFYLLPIASGFFLWGARYVMPWSKSEIHTVLAMASLDEILCFLPKTFKCVSWHRNKWKTNNCQLSHHQYQIIFMF